MRHCGITLHYMSDHCVVYREAAYGTGELRFIICQIYVWCKGMRHTALWNYASLYVRSICGALGGGIRHCEITRHYMYIESTYGAV